MMISVSLELVVVLLKECVNTIFFKGTHSSFYFIVIYTYIHMKAQIDHCVTSESRSNNCCSCELHSRITMGEGAIEGEAFSCGIGLWNRTNIQQMFRPELPEVALSSHTNQ
jgi:hypothetical protein